MKKTIILTAFVFSTAIFSNIYGQQTPPPGAGDKNLANDGVKTRSIELDRVERDAKKPNSATAATAEDKLAAKYKEIKTDYEQIQLSQDNVIKAYQNGNTIDYTQISKSAMEINKSALRLRVNLFPLPTDENTDTKKDENKIVDDTKAAKSVRSLIIDLDNVIGSFVMSPMFQNLRAVDAKISAKAQDDLDKIIELSASLGAEAKKSAVR